MRKVYRMARRKYAQDLSGTGAALFGARWNAKGTYVLYTESSAALAMLEWVAHAHDPDADELYCMVTLSVPDEKVWKIGVPDLPGIWRSSPPPDALKEFGKSLVENKDLFAMEVPSVLMPPDHNLVLDIGHPLFKKVQILDVLELELDKRLLFKAYD